MVGIFYWWFCGGVAVFTSELPVHDTADGDYFDFGDELSKNGKMVHQIGAVNSLATT